MSTKERVFISNTPRDMKPSAEMIDKSNMANLGPVIRVPFSRRFDSRIVHSRATWGQPLATLWGR